ncbi:50S ribosomal protein L25 [Granulicella sp. S156]|jgi:large subunit ribosomal protein L25|uniref:50S ribosomal protein L25 n=1 Tax=Granulicella sp. S156 TaxID=1747224 RepID=UPI00131CE345|nr:50S ribosomal protein L25 [Granulicella sp. S156]
MASNSKIEAVVATPRTGTFNKNHARRVRVSGLIPAVVYGAGQESVAVTVDPKVITKILYSDSGHNTIFDLTIEGKGATKVMIVDWQNEPIKGKLLHIDLKRIAMDKAMRVSVPVQLVGVPVGVKASGGILGQVLHEVEVECLPGDIPSHIDIDVSNLDINGAIHISDLPHTDKLTFLDEEDALVAHVTVAKAEAEPEPVAGPSEPEVAKKGKQDAPAADAAAADKGKK